MMLLGERIYRIRTEAGLTQTQFSEICGVSQQSVQKWESGQVTPDLDKIMIFQVRHHRKPGRHIHPIGSSSTAINLLQTDDVCSTLVDITCKTNQIVLGIVPLTKVG